MKYTHFLTVVRQICKAKCTYTSKTTERSDGEIKYYIVKPK